MRPLLAVLAALVVFAGVPPAAAVGNYTAAHYCKGYGQPAGNWTVICADYYVNISPYGPQFDVQMEFICQQAHVTVECFGVRATSMEFFARYGYRQPAHPLACGSYGTNYCSRGRNYDRAEPSIVVPSGSGCYSPWFAYSATISINNRGVVLSIPKWYGPVLTACT